MIRWSDSSDFLTKSKMFSQRIKQMHCRLKQRSLCYVLSRIVQLATRRLKEVSENVCSRLCLSSLNLGLAYVSSERTSFVDDNGALESTALVSWGSLVFRPSYLFTNCGA